MHTSKKTVEGEEDGNPWVPQQHEMEQRDLEDNGEAEYDAQLDPQAHNSLRVAQEIRRRLVEFLAAQHQPFKRFSVN